MQINPNSTVPVFKQIAQELQSAIAAGIYREGEAIPSARELAMRFTVNPNTVQKAFDELSTLGVIETHRGLGKFVRRGALKNSSKRSRQEVLDVLQDGIRIAAAAGLSRNDVDKLYEKAAKILRRENSQATRSGSGIQGPKTGRS
jgi:GntR family transcriptional regulator